MRVWITRTEPGATRLAAAIAPLGLPTFKAPVLHIQPNRAEPPPGRFDLAVFVSEHAVAHAASNGWAQAPWRDCPSVAIGASASAALRAHGVEPGMAAQANAAGVIEALAALADLPRRTLIVKGEGGRDTVQRFLRRQGAAVVEWNVYRRVATRPDLSGRQVHAIVASSGDAVRPIAAAWFADQRDGRVPLLASSARVAALAARSGFRNVVVTLGANPAAVAAALRRLMRVAGMTCGAVCEAERELGRKPELG